MTEPRTPPPDDREPVDPDVALASAHVDGELDESGQARIAAAPEAAALAVRLAAIAHEVRDVPPPPAGMVDAQVSAALVAMDDDELAADDAPAAAVPFDRPRRTRAWWQRVPLGAAAAALAVIALVGAIGLASQAGDDDQDTATTALGRGDGDESVDAEDDSGALEAAPFDSSGDAFDGASPPRPAFGDYDELVASLQAAPATTSAAATTDDETDRSSEDAAEADEEVTADQGAAPIDPCGAVVVLGLERTEIEQVLPAVVDGDPVTAVVHVTDGERRVSVVDDVQCTATFEGVLTG